MMIVIAVVVAALVPSSVIHLAWKHRFQEYIKSRDKSERAHLESMKETLIDFGIDSLYLE